MPGQQTCRNKARRMKETLLATVDLAGACAGNSTEVTLAVPPAQHTVKAGPGAGAIPSPQLEHGFKAKPDSLT